METVCLTSRFFNLISFAIMRKFSNCLLCTDFGQRYGKSQRVVDFHKKGGHFSGHKSLIILPAVVLILLGFDGCSAGKDWRTANPDSADILPDP